MPVIKMPTAPVRKARLRTSSGIITSTVLPLQTNAAERLWYNLFADNTEIFEPWNYYQVIEVNGSFEDVGIFNYVAGSNGGVFSFASNGDFRFFPGEDFEYLSGAASAVTTITINVLVNGEQTLTYVVSVTVLAYVTPVDALWEDVEFLYQYPPAVYAITDRTGNYPTNVLGSVTWQWDNYSPLSDVFLFGSAASQIAVGAPNDFNFLCNQSTNWTFDGWFMPSTYNSQYLLGMTNAVANGNGFSLLYNYPQESITAIMHKANVVLFTYTFNYVGPINEWNHWAFQFVAANRRLLFFKNGVPAGDVYTLEAFDPAGTSGQLYLGGRFTTPSQSWRGRIAAARLTRGLRWPNIFDSFRMPLAPYPVG